MYVTAAEYYDCLPDAQHQPGDIWLDLPSFGTLKTETTLGIVVTPACDLQNNKTETITYLPIVSINQFFALFAALSDLRGATQSMWTNLANQKCLTDRRFSAIPTEEEIASLRTELGAAVFPTKLAEQKLRVQAGLTSIEAIVRPNQATIDFEHLSLLFGSRDWTTKMERLVTNALRADCHFLPAMTAPVLEGALDNHSVVLFRYALTAPTELLDLASDSSAPDWESALKRYRALPAAKHFALRRPLRIARVHARFMADLITRYLSLYVRLGSPDFAKSQVAQLVRSLVPPT